MEGSFINGASQLKTKGGIYAGKMETLDVEANGVGRVIAIGHLALPVFGCQE
jgi:hypothetical protein